MSRFIEDGKKTKVGRVLLTLGVGAFLVGGCRPSNPELAVAAQKGGTFGDGKGTLDYINKLDFQIAGLGDSLRIAYYPCADASKCPTGGVRLMFIPESRAYKVDWDKNMKANADGDVVALVMNVDNVTFPDLNLAPGERAYAWVGQVGSNSATDRGFAVYRINATGYVDGGPWWLTPKTNIQHCDNSAPRDKPAIHEKHAAGENCRKIASSRGLPGVSTAYAAVPKGMAMQRTGGSLWISCTGGCCEVGDLQLDF